MKSRQFITFFLFMLGFGIITSTQALEETGRETYSGVTPNGSECLLKIVKDPLLKPLRVFEIIYKGTTHSIFVGPGETYVETELMNRDRGYWGEYLGAPSIPTFGIGFRKVVLNVIEDNGVLLSYHLDIKKIFARNVRCNKLERV